MDTFRTLRLPKIKSTETILPPKVLERSILTIRHQANLCSQRIKFQQLRSVDHDAIQLRKNYDKLSSTIRSKGIKIEKGSKDNRLRKGVQQNIEEEVEQAQQKCALLNAKKGSLLQEVDVVVNDRQIFKHILSNLHQDILVYRDRIRCQRQSNARLRLRLEELLQEQQNNFSNYNLKKVQFDSKAAANQQEQMELQKMLEERRKIFQTEQSIEKNRTEFKQRVQNIQLEFASNVSDAYHIKICNMFQAHTFFQKLIRNKIRNSLRENSELEINYSKLKQAATIQDPSKLVERYNTYDLDFLDLIQRISLAQRQIQRLSEELKVKKRRLQYCQKKRDKTMKYKEELYLLFNKPKKNLDTPSEDSDDEELTENYCFLTLARVLDWTDLSLSEAAHACGNKSLLPERKAGLDAKVLRLVRLVKRELLNDWEEINAQGREDDLFSSILKGTDTSKTGSIDLIN